MRIKINNFIATNKEKNIKLLSERYNLEPNENALFKAIFLEDLTLLKILLACDMDFNQKINNTYPIHFAAFRGNLEVFKFIYSILNTIDGKALSTAILNNKVGIVKFILSELGKGRVDIDLDDYVDGNFTPLSLAIMVGNMEVAKLLLELGVDANKVEKKRGDSPLMLAITSNNYPITEMLLNNNANPNFIGLDDFTPLIVAAYIGNLPMVKLLVQHNGDLHYTTTEGYDVLRISMMNNKTEIAEYIQKINKDR